MHARCRNGLGYVTEERSVIMDMSVADNLKLARVAPADAFGYFPALEAIMDRGDHGSEGRAVLGR
jgi:branched-chain amino acid transport system ATP-binding protein